MKVVNVLTAILAVILSIAFVLTAIATVITASVVAFIEPKNIVKLVQSIDYEALFESINKNDEVKGEGNNIGDSSVESETDAPIESETDVAVDEVVSELKGALESLEGEEAALINDIMQSDTVKGLIDEYAQGMLSVITGEEVPEGITADKIKDIADENMDEIVGIVEEYTDEDVDEAELRAEIETLIDENAEEIAGLLPSAEELKSNVEHDVIKMLGKVFRPTLTYMMIGAAVVLALLIYACRFKNFKGFLWVGVDCIIASLFVGLISGAARIGETLIVKYMGLDITIVKSVLDILTGTINTGLIVLVASAAVCIIAFVVLKKTVVNKKQIQSL